MAERRSNWPFAPTDGGPGSRPRVVGLDNVLVAIVASTAAAEGAAGALRSRGFTDATLRVYTSEEMLAYDDAFRSGRSFSDRIVGTVVDDADGMARYLSYARDGCSALWVLTADRDDADRVIRCLADYEPVYVWYHGPGGLKTIRIR